MKKNIFFFTAIFFATLSLTSCDALFKFEPSRPRVPYNTRDVWLVRLFRIFNAIEDEDKPEISRLIKEYPSLIVMQDSRGYTPLHHAVASQKLVSLRVLSDCANIEQAFTVRDRVTGYTPLHLAIMLEDSKITTALLVCDHIHRALVVKDRHNYDTPLHLAIRMDRMDSMQALLIHSFIHLSFGKRDKAGLTPLELYYHLRTPVRSYHDSISLGILETAYKDSGLLLAFNALRIVGSKVIQRSSVSARRPRTSQIDLKSRPRVNPRVRPQSSRY